MEEDIEEITHFSSSLKEDPVPANAVENKSSSSVTSSSLELSCVEPQKWVIQNKTILNWTPSTSPDPVSSASGLPSLPSFQSPVDVEFSQPFKFIPPPPVGSCSNTDLLHEDLSSTSKNRKEPDSPEKTSERRQEITL